MKRFVLGCVCFLSQLIAFDFVFVPDYGPYAKTIFPAGPVTDFRDAPFWWKIKYLLNREGYNVYGAAANELPDSREAMQNWLQNAKRNEVKLVLWSQAMPLERVQTIGQDYLALLVFEPPSVYPNMHTSSYYNCFSKVITWEDDLIDGQKFCKFRYPVYNPMTRDTIPLARRKLCCVMAANKKSNFINELYSERLKAIQYFNKYPEHFDLYGPDWHKKGFVCYKGWVEDKIKTLKHYKFAICYENTKEVKGYITEKIFDCFQAGVVPVYWGAPNITDEVPANCFIDRRRFSCYEELHQYLLSMTEEQYNKILANIRTYLASEKAQQYSVDASVVAVVNGLIGTQYTVEDLPR